MFGKYILYYVYVNFDRYNAFSAKNDEIVETEIRYEHSPNNGTAFKSPLSEELRLKSHCADGNTKETTLTDMAQFM